MNDAPVALADVANAVEDGPAVAIDVLANDTDVYSGDTRTVAAIDTHGTVGPVTIDAGGTGVHYAVGSAFQSLRAGVTATDSFTYRMKDAAGATSTASVTVTITGVNDTPVAGADVANAVEDGPAVAINVLANDTDADSGDSRAVTTID